METNYIHSPLKPLTRIQSIDGEHGILMSKCKGQTCPGRRAYLKYKVLAAPTEQKKIHGLMDPLSILKDILSILRPCVYGM
jgi:hypothetical protein